MAIPETKYAWNGDVALAYQVVGEGPVDLIFMEGYASHVDINWESPYMARFLRGLAGHARLIVTDRRGYGCSDRFSPSDVPPLEATVDDLIAVMDAAGSERAAIFGTMFAGFVAALFDDILGAAQGFVAAQDRLFQMELWKRSGQGRLAEVLGPSALQRDINARRLQYRGNMKAEYESYAPDTKEILEDFTAGINAYIAGRTAAGSLPVEFQIAGFKPEPWKPEDCVLMIYAMTLDLQDEDAVALVADRQPRPRRGRRLDPQAVAGHGQLGPGE